MVKAVKSKTARSLAKGEQAVLLPGSTMAEPWEVWVTGPAGASCLQVCATPAENRVGKSGALALPVSQVYCLPLWLNETHAKQFASVIALQLELRGLQPRGNSSAVFDWVVVAQEGTRTLVMVGVLPALLPSEMEAVAYRTFDASVRYLAFPPNSLSLWLEQDRLAMAITRESTLVYFQSLSEEHITLRVLQDLGAVCASLKMQDIIVSLRQVFLALPVTGAELSQIRTALLLPIKQGERPAPSWPSTPWKLVPPQVRAAKKTRETHRWQGRGLLVALLLYLLLVAWLVSTYFMTSLQVEDLRKWQAKNAPTLQMVHETQAIWKELRPVVDESSYPLEQLLHVSDSLPADQLHLTLYEAHDGNLLIKGEAKNVAAAFQFLDGLKHDAHFNHYNWEMSQPHLLPNDLAQMQIEGTHANLN